MMFNAIHLFICSYVVPHVPVLVKGVPSPGEMQEWNLEKSLVHHWVRVPGEKPHNCEEYANPSKKAPEPGSC